MAAVTIFRDFRAQEEETCHCFHLFPFDLSWSDGAGSVQFSSVPQLCPTIWDPMDCSTPSLPVHHQLLEFTQTHITFGSPLMQGWSPLEPQLILARVSYLIAHFVEAADFGFNSLYAGRHSKNKFKTFKIGKRPQDKRDSVLSNFSGFLSSLQFWPNNSW